MLNTENQSRIEPNIWIHTIATVYTDGECRLGVGVNCILRLSLTMVDLIRDQLEMMENYSCCLKMVTLVDRYQCEMYLPDEYVASQLEPYSETIGKRYTIINPPDAGLLEQTEVLSPLVVQTTRTVTGAEVTVHDINQTHHVLLTDEFLSALMSHAHTLLTGLSGSQE